MPQRLFPMLNALNKETARLFARKSRWMLAYLRQELIGIAHDFWKDGIWERLPGRGGDDFNKYLSPEALSETEAPMPWHAAPGEISEKMWGQGNARPGDDVLTDLLIQPFGLTKNVSLLDLSAGLGGRMRKIGERFNIVLSGREADPEIALRGAALLAAAGLGGRASITPYDPMNWVEKNKADCVVLRETIYRTADKDKFVKSIAACCNDDAQVSFTDYIVNPEYKDQAAIAAWRKGEPPADPLSLVEMAELWARAGFSLRVHDDQTGFYRKEIKHGLLRLAQFMAGGIKPDAETKKAIEKQLTVWALRMAALDSGMKFYRFYGLK